ncbi:zinc ABC transporter substrate-binding protein [Candidatus Roizmanbacteria bacterium]|nr:MAG: zinc ABC transporter substrate-binding protein [Candidatus Roizmanbacteria bacterium]
MKKILFLLFLGIILALVIVLGYNRQGKETDLDRQKVATTIFPLYDITKNIAGNNVEIVLLLPAGASPHSYEPSPETVKTLQGADTLFMIGHGIDNWSTSVAESAGVKNQVVVDEKIKLLPYTGANHSHDEKTGEEVAENNYSEQTDPHYWLSIENGKAIAAQIRDELSKLYPEHKESFEQNYNEYEAVLAALDQDNRSKLQAIENKRIATFHNAFGYLAEEYDIEVVTTFEEFPGEEPSPEYVQEFIDHIEEDDIRVVFAEPQFSTTSLEPIAADLEISISQLDPIGGVPDKDSFVSLMRYNVNQITQALQ